MATNLHTDSGLGIGELVSGIVHDAQELISQQFTLAKQEIKEDFRKTRDAMTILALAGGVLFVGALLLGLTLVHLVAWLAPTWELWHCYAVVTAGVLAIGTLLGYLGVQRFRSFNVLPNQTAKALEENLEWKTKPT